jgi:folate-dependent phosphoribosylglycinamide formyltransferase PurN
MRVKVAVLVSGFGSNLQALIDATHEEDYPGLIVLVISNRDEASAPSGFRRPHQLRPRAGWHPSRT